MIPVFRPFVGKEEVKAIAEVLNSRWIGLGPKTEEFEQKLAKYLDAKYVVATNSATAALHLALIVAGVKENDEVISPSLTFISTNHVILYQKARPVFCDVREDNLCADVNDIVRKITPKTKAIIVVHYGGFAVDMDPLMEAARKKGICVIEDASHACGAEYKGKKLGTIGDINCLSFHAVKGLAMGDGGAVIVNNKRDADRLKKLRWMGINKDTWERADGGKKYSWYYDVEEVGFKYHMNDIAAAIGLVQLKKLDEIIAKKRRIFNRYNKLLKGIDWLETPREKPDEKSSFHNYCLKIKKGRNRLGEYLAKKGIATTVHYFPNHYYPMYKKYSCRLPVTEKIWKKILLLPMYPELKEKDLKYIAGNIKKFKP